MALVLLQHNFPTADTQYDASTPDEYLIAIENDWRRDTILALRDLIREHAPEFNEGIAYKMLSYKDDRGSVFGLNAQKGYVSFYVGDIGKVDPTGELLQGSALRSQVRLRPGTANTLVSI